MTTEVRWLLFIAVHLDDLHIASLLGFLEALGIAYQGASGIDAFVFRGIRFISSCFQDSLFPILLALAGSFREGHRSVLLFSFGIDAEFLEALLELLEIVLALRWQRFVDLLPALPLRLHSHEYGVFHFSPANGVSFRGTCGISGGWRLFRRFGSRRGR